MVNSNLSQTFSKYSNLVLGENFVGWEEKFNPESEFSKGQIFVNGTKIQTRVNVHEFKGKLAFRTAHSCHIDGRYVDTFFPVDLSDAIVSQIKFLGIRELEIQIQIIDQLHKNFIISCCIDYEVSLLSILKIDEVVDIKNFLTHKYESNVIIQAKVIDYLAHSDNGYITLQQKDGTKVTLNFDSYGMGYDTSAYEITFPITPFNDDLVQASIYYHTKKNKYIVDSLHLVQECKIRATTRKQLATDCDLVINKLKNSIEDSGLNELLSSNVDNSNLTLLTVKQIETIKKTINDTHGSDNIPFVMLLKDCDLYEMKEIAKVYGKDNIYTINLKQFLEFCEQVAQCQIPFVSSGACDYHIRYLMDLCSEDVISNLQYANILSLTIGSYFNRIQNKNYLASNGIPGYTDNDYTFTHTYLLKQAFCYSYDVQSVVLINLIVSITQKIIDLAEVQVNSYNGEKSEIDLRDQPFEEIANFFVTQFYKFADLPFYLCSAVPFLDFEPKIDELIAKIIEFQKVHQLTDTYMDHYISCTANSLQNLKVSLNKINKIFVK